MERRKNKQGLFSQLFGEAAKERKELKKLQKSYASYLKLDAKLLKGSIHKKELDNYYALKEEINKMAKKFTLKDGKFILKTDEAKKEDVKTQTDVEESGSANDMMSDSEMANNITESIGDKKSNEYLSDIKDAKEKEIGELEKMQERLIMLKQQQAEQAQMQHAQMRQAQIQQAQMQQQMRQAHIIHPQMQEQQMRQAQMQEQQMRQAQMQEQQMQEQQMLKQQQADAALQAQVAQEESRRKQPQGRLVVHVFVSDLPELSLGINEGSVEAFSKAINAAMAQGLPFEFGPYILNGAKILMYRFN